MYSQTNQLKYKLKELLENQPVKKYKHDLKMLPIITGKCKNTIKGYSEIPLHAKTEMPYDVGWIIEDYYNLLPRGLYNVKMDIKDLIKKRSDPNNQ
jgi:hypothetical protein